ncbi:MAG: tetratricopeptide repeat protein [Acidobacteriota bacterium]
MPVQLPAREGSRALLLWLVLVFVAALAMAQGLDPEEEAERRFDVLNRIAEAHFEKAWLLQEAGRSDEAIAELKKALELPFPPGEISEERRLGVVLALCEMYLEQGRPLDAARTAEGVLDEWQEQPARLAELHIILGYAYRALEQNDKALRHFDRAIELGQKALDEP